MANRRFYDCTLNEKLLYTCFLILIGLGYLMAVSYLYLGHAASDGKPGLSIQDVANSYYGNRSGTRLEAAIRGPMASYITDPDRHVIVAWLKEGAPEEGYANEIRPILEKSCLTCHGGASTSGPPALTSYEHLREWIRVDTGMSIATLLKLSHIHLFGISLLLFALGYIFILSEVAVWLKRVLLITPMLAVLVDILAWFLTKWDPVYAYTVVLAGAALGLSMMLQIMISLYQIWFLRRPVK